MLRAARIALVLVVSIAAIPTFADTIKLAADVWMPFNGDGTTETGYMLDVAKEVFSKAGHTVTFETTPWSRAIEEARKGQYNGIIGAVVTDAPDFVFPKNELALTNTEFFVKKGNPWRFKGIASLAGIKLTVIKDYSYYDDLDKYIADNQASKDKLDVSFGDNVTESNLQKLVNGRIDALVDSGAVIMYMVKKLKLEGQVERAGVGHPGAKTFIAFSPALASSKKYAQILSDGIDAMRKSGALKKILAVYGLTDWK